MRRRVTARRVVTASLSVLILASCGDEEPPRATATATATATPEARELRITSPKAGTRVDGRFIGPARVAGRVTVGGEATPGATVLLSGGCAALGCRSVVRAGADGEWTAALRVEAPARRPLATVSASDPAGEGAPRLRVRLRVPEVEAEPPPRRPEPEPTVAARERPTAFVMVGDSLAEGTEPLLPALLEGWTVTQDALINRTLGEGMEVFRDLALPPGPRVLAFSLFTNDDPRNVDALEAAVRESVEASAGGCAVWATIVRPPFGGVSYRAANARLEALTFEPQLAGRLLVVPWADAVAARPAWLAADDVHATPEGYRGRAQMYADAARSCGA